MLKFVMLVLKAVHLLAHREQVAQAHRQAKFRRERAKRSENLRNDAADAYAKAQALDTLAAQANAESIIGSNSINEAERAASTLKASLDHIVKPQQ